jgi:hypothetical protein
LSRDFDYSLRHFDIGARDGVGSPPGWLCIRNRMAHPLLVSNITATVGRVESGPNSWLSVIIVLARYVADDNFEACWIMASRIR